MTSMTPEKYVEMLRSKINQSNNSKTKSTSVKPVVKTAMKSVAFAPIPVFVPEPAPVNMVKSTPSKSGISNIEKLLIAGVLATGTNVVYKKYYKKQ